MLWSTILITLNLIYFVDHAHAMGNSVETCSYVDAFEIHVPAVVLSGILSIRDYGGEPPTFSISEDFGEIIQMRIISVLTVLFFQTVRFSLRSKR